MRLALVLTVLVAAESAAAARVLNRLGPYPRLDRRDRLSNSAGSYFATILAADYALPGGECSGQNLTTSQGSTVTWTRTSSAYCLKSTGEWVSVAANQPRLATVGGRPALLAEPAATNLVLYNRDLSNAAWTRTNLTCTKTGTGIDGLSNSASLCTADAANGQALQSVTYSANGALSFFVKRVTGSGNIQWTMDGTTFTTLTSSNCRKTTDFATSTPSSSYWVRCNLTLTGAPTTKTIGLRLATSGDQILTDMWQAEVSSILTPTSPIETAGTSATRTAEVGTFSAPAGYSATVGCMRLTLTSPQTGAPASGQWLRSSTSTATFIAGSSGGSYAASDTASTTLISGNFTAWTAKSFATRWNQSGNLRRVENLSDGTGTTGTFVGWGTAGTWNLANRSSDLAVPAFGWLTNIALSASYSWCTL